MQGESKMRRLRPEPEILKTLERFKKEKPTEMDMLDIEKSILEHLSQPAGTLANYNGKFGRPLISLLIEKGWITEDDVQASVDEKLLSVANKVLNDFHHGKYTKCNTQLVKVIMDYMQSKNESNNQCNNVVLVGYPTEKEGKETKPERRRRIIKGL